MQSKDDNAGVLIAILIIVILTCLYGIFHKEESTIKIEDGYCPIADSFKISIRDKQRNWEERFGFGLGEIKSLKEEVEKYRAHIQKCQNTHCQNNKFSELQRCDRLINLCEYGQYTTEEKLALLKAMKELAIAGLKAQASGD